MTDPTNHLSSKDQNPVKHFRTTAVYTIASLLIALIAGLNATHSVIDALAMALMALIAGILETSMSFDNAVANAFLLHQMDPKWRSRFISWGMPIAVFGMRGVFPVAILSFALGMGPVAAIHTAITDPVAYGAALAHSRPYLMMFGGAFLLQVALGFFLDPEKEVHWLELMERPLQALGVSSVMPTLIGLFLILAAGAVSENAPGMVLAGLIGMALHYGIEKLGDILGDESRALEKATAGGLAAFISLEVMDASMSFDGVIGAMAITTNPLIITLGLGIGAMFVRAITLYFVEQDTLAEYIYLEHGAFWAILVLAGMMFASTKIEVPDIISGLTGASLVGLAFWASLRWNKNNPHHV